jgi:hypothetical protein
MVVLLFPLQLAASELILDLRTDYVGGLDFSLVRVQLIDRADERRSWHTLQPMRAGDFLRGERIAEFADVNRGVYLVSVELLDELMRPVHGRIWLLDMGSSSYGMVALIVRP